MSQAKEFDRVGVAIKLIEKMDLVERADLLAEVDDILAEARDARRVKYARKEAEAIKDKLKKPGSGGFMRTKKKPFWIKSAEYFDDGGTGANKIGGDWVKDLDWVDEGEFVLVGLRYPQKRYAVCVKESGEDVALFGDVRPDYPIELKGVRVVEMFETFGEVMKWGRANLPGPKREDEEGSD